MFSLLSPPLTGRDLRDTRLNAEAEGHAKGAAGGVTVGVAVAVHTTEAVGGAGTRRTLPSPIPLTILLALAIGRVLSLVPLVPLTLITAGINLATEDLLLRKNEQLVNGRNPHFLLAALCGDLHHGLDDRFQISGKLLLEEVAVELGTEVGSCLLYTSPSPRDS